MARYQVISQVGRSLNAFNNLLNYIAKPSHCIGRFIGATNLHISAYQNPELEIMNQISYVLNHYKAWNRRLALHILVEFDPGEAEMLSPEAALQFGYQFAVSVFPGYMCYFAVHDNTPLLHLHFMVVTCNIFNGGVFSAGKSGWYKIGNDGNRMLEQYVGSENLCPVQVTPGRTPRNKKEVKK